jgi:RimJ/RimL family protein N-acetyltransferase
MNKFPETYNCLSQQVFTNHTYSIIPIRFEDRLDIMKWRNEQMYHLRQASPLSIEGQTNYFNTTVSKLFDQIKPNQILFSYLKNNQCIGYGGLVHINWIDKNAEISFIMDTQLEEKEFHKHWGNYLELIEKVAFETLNLHKVYVYAFDLRPHLYTALQSNNFNKEAILKEQCFFEGKFIDVIIHEKRNTK